MGPRLVPRWGPIPPLRARKPSSVRPGSGAKSRCCSPSEAEFGLSMAAAARDPGASDEFLLAVTVQNLKKLVRFIGDDPQSTISRLENLPDRRALLSLGRGLIDQYCASFRQVPKRIVLDVDDTFDRVHGGQQLRLFNADHDDYGFQPIVVFDGEGCFVTSPEATMFMMHSNTNLAPATIFCGPGRRGISLCRASSSNISSIAPFQRPTARASASPLRSQRSGSTGRKRCSAKRPAEPRPTAPSFAASLTSSTPAVLMVTRLDLLARSTRDLLNTLAAITDRKAGFRSLGDAWADTTTAHGRLMLTVLGGLAEFERDLIPLSPAAANRRSADPALMLASNPGPTWDQSSAQGSRKQGEGGGLGYRRNHRRKIPEHSLVIGSR